jgi:hypothetical protein
MKSPCLSAVVRECRTKEEKGGRMSVSAMSFGRGWFEPVPPPTTSGPRLTPHSGRVLGASYPGLKPWLFCGAILWRFIHSNPPQYPNTPVPQHSSTPTLQHSSTPVLQCSSTPSLHLSISPSPALLLTECTLKFAQNDLRLLA